MAPPRKLTPEQEAGLEYEQLQQQRRDGVVRGLVRADGTPMSDSDQAYWDRLHARDRSYQKKPAHAPSTRWRPIDMGPLDLSSSGKPLPPPPPNWDPASVPGDVDYASPPSPYDARSLPAAKGSVDVNFAEDSPRHGFSGASARSGVDPAAAWERGKGLLDVDEYGRPVAHGRVGETRAGYPDAEGYADSEQQLLEQLREREERGKAGPSGPLGLSDELLLRIPGELRPGKTGNWFPQDFAKRFTEAFVDGNIDISPDEFKQVMDRFNKFSLSPFDPMTKSKRAEFDASSLMDRAGLAESAELGKGEEQQANVYRDVLEEIRSESYRQKRYQEDLQDEIRMKQADVAKTIEELSQKANDFNPYGSSMGQLFAVIGQSIGAYGAAMGKTPNYAADIVNQMIDARVKKMHVDMQAGQFKANAQNNAVGYAMQALNDQRIADEAVRGAMFKQALIEVEAIKLTSGSKAKKAKADLLAEAIKQKWISREEGLKFQIESMAQQAAGGRAAARDENAELLAQQLYGGQIPITGNPEGEKNEFLGPNAYLPPGMNKSLSEGMAGAETMLSALDTMEATLGKGLTGIGVPWTGAASHAWDLAQTEIATGYKSLKQLGTWDDGVKDLTKSLDIAAGMNPADKKQRINNLRQRIIAAQQASLKGARASARYYREVPVLSKDKAALTGLKAERGYIQQQPDNVPGQVGFQGRQ